MASLGFRPPQFSEDMAWLPAWLQQHQKESFDKQVKGLHTHSGQAFKDFSFLQGSINNDANLLSSEEGRYKSCHLFLSGGDSSPFISDSSPRNALHFHLHISLDDSSEQLPSPLLGKIQVGRHESEIGLQLQHAENSFGAAEKANQSEMGHTAGPMDLLTPNLDPLENNNLKNLNRNKDSGSQFQDKLDIENLELVDEINAAVEFSIAASEALAIHESVKCGSPSEAMPAATVLEVALRVKEARLEGFEATSHCVHEEADEIDSLLDLGESPMADAFEDVGLSITGPDDLHVSSSTISWVEETPVPVNPYGCDDKVIHVESSSQKTIHDSISRKHNVYDDLVTDTASKNGLPSEICVSKRQEKLHDNHSLHFYSSCHLNGSLHELIEAGPGVSMRERFDLVTENITSSQCQGNMISENSGQEHQVGKLAPEKFTSGWLGGWTEKSYF